MNTGDPQIMDGVHAPYGVLVRDEQSDTVLCHLCGQWFRALGSHVRVHGLTADGYRTAFGLYRTRPLTSREISKVRTETQRNCYHGSPRTAPTWRPAAPWPRRAA